MLEGIVLVDDQRANFQRPRRREAEVVEESYHLSLSAAEEPIRCTSASILQGWVQWVVHYRVGAPFTS